jgi:putative hydrolase of HD superfamily
MKEEMINILNFLKKIEKLKSITRHSKTSSGRRESSAEHSWRMAIMTILFYKYFPDIDILKVIKMCLYHDLGEILEGDIPAFYKNNNDEEHEYDNLMKLFEDINLDIKDEILEIVNEFNKQDSEEAKLATAIDKLEGIIQHNEADINTWIKKEYQFNMEYAINETQYNDFLKEFREVVREVTIGKIKKANAEK